MFTVIYLYLHKCLLYTGKEGKEGKEGKVRVHVCARVLEGRVRVCTSTTPTGKEIWKARVPEGNVRVGTKGVRVCTSTTPPSLPKSRREGTSKGEGGYEKKGTGGYG